MFNEEVRSNFSEKINVFNWECIGSLPAQLGFEENIGTAGMLSGVINGKLVVAGGANFPYESALNRGEKIIHRDIYLFDEENGRLRIIDQRQFDYPIAYGASCVVDDILYFIVNNPSHKYESDIIAVKEEDSKLSISVVGSIPMKIENIVMESIGGKLYFGVGSISGEHSNRFYSYDIELGNISELESFPGYPRSQCVSSLLLNDDGEEHIVVFGGGSNEAYLDGFSYDVSTNTWNTLSDILIEGEGVSVLGAGYTRVSDSELLIVGGFNKQLWKEACYNLSNLKGDEHTRYRNNYFSMDPEEYGWNKKILVYNFKDDTWRSLGEIQFNPPCGNSLLINNNRIYSIMGEIKPGIRTPDIYRSIIEL